MINPADYGLGWWVLSLALLAVWPAHNVVLAVFALWKPAPAAGRMTSLRFWIVIPALNEERVVAATVASALALRWHGQGLNVLVVDDGSTDATPEILAGIQDPRLHVLRREAPNARQGKGEALNAAYRYVRDATRRHGVPEESVVLGVIDGDGRGAPDLLAKVAALFTDGGTGAVQCRVRIHNRNRWLGLLQDIEFSCVADASQSMRDMLGSVDLGGNGQFVRLSELMRLGDRPWSGCLVEDLELGLRMHMQGARIRYATHAVITQQAVVDPRRLVRQRTRWGQGNLQCVGHLPRLFLSRQVRTLPLLEFAYYLLTPWLMVPMSLAVLGLLGLGVYGEVTRSTLGGLVAIGPDLPIAGGICLVALVLPGLLWGLVHRLRLGDEPLHRTLLAGLLYPVFMGLGVIAAWRALGRHVTRRNAWAKTERLVEDTPQNQTERRLTIAA